MIFMIFFSYADFHMEITLWEVYLLNSLSSPQWFTMHHLLYKKDSYLGPFLGSLSYSTDLFVHVWAVLSYYLTCYIIL